MKTKLRMLTVALVLALISPIAHAEGPPPGDPREACRADAKTFCQGVQPGGGRIKDCLKDHYKEISDACYSALSKATSPHGQGGPSKGDPVGSTDSGQNNQDHGD